MNYIHETIIRDIIDLASEIKDTDIDSINSTLNRKNSFKSIASQSANLTAVFPVIVSKSINIDNASMVTKAIERKAVSMLQLLFAARQLTTVTDNVEHFKQFHSNLKIDNSLSVDGILDVIDKYVTESTNSRSTNYIILEKDQLELVKKDYKNLDSYLEENVNDKSILSYSVLPKGKYGKSYIVENNNKKGVDYDSYSKFAQTSTNLKSFTTQNILIDSDVRKANELVPTIMTVNIMMKKDNNLVPMSYVIGVKAKMYAVDSMDVINRLAMKDTDNKILTKFIKATTREISFLKDFLFAIDNAKIDAISQSRRGSSSKLWKILERRAAKSRIKRRLGLTNDAMAITSLVISQEEVNYIKKEYNIDLEISEVIRPIMEKMNLICFCIVDETNDVAKFIFDTGEDVYEYISFNSLEREASDNSYKKMVNLMSKITR